MSFFVLNKEGSRFDYLGKNWKFFTSVRVRPKYGLSLVFRLSPVCSKFKFSADIQLFGLKTTSHGKSDPKIHF